MYKYSSVSMRLDHLAQAIALVTKAGSDATPFSAAESEALMKCLRTASAIAHRVVNERETSNAVRKRASQTTAQRAKAVEFFAHWRS